MKHIFYLHSNICAIVSYSIISELVRNNEEVVIVSERKTTFPSFNDKIKIFDVQHVIDTFRKKDQKLIGHVINYKFDLIPQLKKFAKEIIDSQKFILYIPSCNMFTIKHFLKDKNCCGYYFIEEGTLSYLSKGKLKERYFTSKYRQGKILLSLLGMGVAYEFKQSNKFMGCICLSDKGFPWCPGSQKKVVDIKESLSAFEKNTIKTDVVITTDYLRGPLNNYLKAFDLVINNIVEENPNITIYIKFHPTAYLFEETKMKKICGFIDGKYFKNVKGYLPPSFLMEGFLCDSRVSLYSIFGISSLLLYALAFGSTAFIVNMDNDEVRTDEIDGVDKFLELSNNT